MGHNHTTEVEGCFACKLRTLHFGVVPGGYRATSSTTYYDSDSLPDFPSKEEVMDARSDYRNAPEREMRLAETGILETSASR